MSMIICWMRTVTNTGFKAVKAKESPCSKNKGIRLYVCLVENEMHLFIIAAPMLCDH